MLNEAAVTDDPGRKQIPVTPTLVIGLGKFGQHVGIQLAARLLLTEAGLRQEGLARPVLVHVDNNGQVMPGLVRIMKLDWDQWFGSNFALHTFLKDIELKGPGEAEKRTPPQIREDNRHPEDWIDAKKALQHMVEQMVMVSLPLREHDMPMRIGNYLPPDKDHDLLIRIFVICAAREADSAALTPRLVELLGEKYVIEGLARGVHLLCYVGGTPRAEHLEAGGSDADYDKLLSTEIDRICPPRSPQSSSQVGMLQQLDELSKSQFPQTLETCYLLDNNLANRQAAIQGRQDEPDEVVVAAALALNMFIATNGDQSIRQAISRRWNLKDHSVEPGLFATLGIASYAVDHPKLRRYVYSRVVGSFLRSAQPKTAGEKVSPQGSSVVLQDEELADDPVLEALLNRDVQKQVNEYSKGISYKVVESKIPKGNAGVDKKVDYKLAIAALRHCDPTDRQTVRDALDKITVNLVDEIRSSALTYRIQQRQGLYTSILQSEAILRLQDHFGSEQAPLTRVYRFLPNALSMLEREAKRYNSPLTVQESRQARDTFVQDQEELFERAMGEKVTDLQAALLRRPRWIGAIFRRLRIRKALRQLEEKHGSILQKADQEAWREGLTEALLQMDSLVTQRVKPLCMPNGVISRLRDQSLADEFITQDRVLERVFFDEQLKQDLRIFSQQLAERGTLWNRRKHLLQELIENQPVEQEKIGAWLRENAEMLYRDDAMFVSQLINRFLDYKTVQRLNEMWHSLSGAAVPLLRHDVYSQDDPSVEVRLFGGHGLQDFDELRILARSFNVQILDSADRLRWIFMNSDAGLHLEGIKFSVEFLMP